MTASVGVASAHVRRWPIDPNRRSSPGPARRGPRGWSGPTRSCLAAGPSRPDAGRRAERPAADRPTVPGDRSIPRGWRSVGGRLAGGTLGGLRLARPLANARRGRMAPSSKPPHADAVTARMPTSARATRPVFAGPKTSAEPLGAGVAWPARRPGSTHTPLATPRRGQSRVPAARVRAGMVGLAWEPSIVPLGALRCAVWQRHFGEEQRGSVS